MRDLVLIVASEELSLRNLGGAINRELVVARRMIQSSRRHKINTAPAGNLRGGIRLNYYKIFSQGCRKQHLGYREFLTANVYRGYRARGGNDISRTYTHSPLGGRNISRGCINEIESIA